MMLRACIFAAAAFAALSSAAAQTPVMAVTPGGIPFAHAHLPKKANQLIAYGWRDGTALGGGAKAAAGQVAAQWISRGTLTRSAGEIDELLKDVAGSSGLFSGLELLTGSVQAPAAGFAEAVEIAADILANPAFPERALLRIKRGYAERARQGAENNTSIADRMLSGLAVSDRNFLRIWSQTDGALADSISRADVEAWRAAVMGLDKVVVASAGPLPAAEAGALIDKLFQGLPRTSSAPAANPPAFTRSQKFVLLEKGGPQSIVRMGGISGWKPGLRAFEAGLAAGILGGGGFESRLTRAIREKDRKSVV